MQLKPITAIAVLFLVVASLLVSGCTSPTTSNTSTTGPALTMSARWQSHEYDVYNGETVTINATVNNEHAGTLKLSTDNFLMQDSARYEHTALGNKPAVTIVENGEYSVFTIHFPIGAGASPTALTYYDGTNKVDCTINWR